MERIQFNTGQYLELTTNSPFFKKTYYSRIIQAKDNGLVISNPYDNGTIVLLNVGLKINVVIQENKYSFASEILAKDPKNKTLFISTPYGISRNGRCKDTGFAKVISITSGKGGVGKTSFIINFALSLCSFGKKVFLFDADLGMANIDVLLGLKPHFDITDVLYGDKAIADIILEGPLGLKVIPGGSGLQELANLSDAQFNKIMVGFNHIEKEADYLLIDTGSGLSRNVTDFLLASDTAIIVTTPEPHAITDAYSIIKVISTFEKKPSLKLVINKVETKEEGEEVSQKIIATAERFLGLKIQSLGFIYLDDFFRRSIKAQIPLSLFAPYSPGARNIKTIALREIGTISSCSEQKETFLLKLKSLFKSFK